MGGSFSFCRKHSGDGSLHGRSVFEKQTSYPAQSFLSRGCNCFEDSRGSENDCTLL